MRIALVHPTYWPEVRRGSERMVHDLGASLAARGHQVTLLTSHLGRTSVAVEDGVEVVRHRRPPDDLPLTRAYEYHILNVPNVVRALARGNFDIAHTLFPADAWAAAKARRWGGPEYVFSFNGIPTREYLVSRRYRLQMLQTAIAGARRVTVLSEAAARDFRRFLLHDPLVLPPGVQLDRFASSGSKSPAPTLLCASSLGDPRKRGELLLAAFEELRSRKPGVRLRLVSVRDRVMSQAAPGGGEGVEWIDADRTEALVGAYSEAWATVLPAPDEAFGLVLLESFAAGTPVVAARAGGPAELVDNPRLGCLFEPDDRAALTAALAEALEMSRTDGVAEACRRRAAKFSWAKLVVRYEQLYELALGGGARPA